MLFLFVQIKILSKNRPKKQEVKMDGGKFAIMDILAMYIKAAL